MRRIIALFFICLSLPAFAAAPPKPFDQSKPLEGAILEVYKKAGDVELHAHIFNPPDHKPADKRPAIVFIHGGAWRNGTPEVYHKQGLYMAERGMVAISIQYRLMSQKGVTIDNCIADAKSAIRWARTNAARLGIDPDRIAVGGSSAGGHLAACTGVLKGFEEPGEPTTVSALPNAMILLCAVSDTTGSGYRISGESKEKQEEVSPIRSVRAGLPPSLLIHCKDDTTVKYANAVAFHEAMKKAGNNCTLVSFDTGGHVVHRWNPPDGGENFKKVNVAMDEFLVGLGFLKPKPAK